MRSARTTGTVTRVNDMISPDFKKIPLYLLIVPLYFSCSNFASRTFYNSLDYYLLYKINSFYDINREQGGFLKERLSEHLRWHRKTILPEFIIILTRMKVRFENGLEAGDCEWIWKNFQNTNIKTYSRLLDDSVIFLAGLEKQQIEHFAEKVKAFNQKDREKAGKTEAELLEKRSAFHLKYLTFFYGEFSDKQKLLISEKVKNLGGFERNRIKYRSKMQQQFIRLIGKNGNRQELNRLLYRWFVDRQYREKSPYRKKFNYYVDRCFQMVEYIDRSVVTHIQRKHAIRKCDELVAMAHKLINE